MISALGNSRLTMPTISSVEALSTTTTEYETLLVPWNTDSRQFFSNSNPFQATIDMQTSTIDS
jgi:hypothetical protein